ncbi:MAG: DUF3574 domain-containing protein [Thermodesulfobacteriota bacterium]
MKIVKIIFPRILALLLAFLAGASCYTKDIELKSDRDHANRCEFVLDQLYLGTKTPKGIVSEEEWKPFLETVVSPKFPGGFTVIDGYGQWRGNNNEVMKENTRVLQIAHDNRQEENRKVEEIIEEYKSKFDQESVLRITTCSWVEF